MSRRRVRIPCPDGIKGCAVAHYKWVDDETIPGLFDTPDVELLKHIKYRMKMIRADHALSTGYHKRYLTGQYDAYDDILRRLKREEVTGDEPNGRGPGS